MAVDLFANAANTTLAAGIAAGATSLTVASSAPFPAATTAAATQFRVIIDSELFIVTNVTGTTWTVTPGAEGTTQAAHANAAVVTALFTAGAITALSTKAFSGVYAANSYYQFGANGGFAPSEAVETCYPLVVGQNVTADRLSVSVTTAGSAGAVMRLGLRNDTGRGLPGTLILDAGTVVASAAAIVAITISQALTPGLYWVTATCQGAAATRPVVRGGSVNSPVQPVVGWLGGGIASDSQAPQGYQSSSTITGALPGTFTAANTIGQSGQTTVWVRFA